MNGRYFGCRNRFGLAVAVYALHNSVMRRIEVLCLLDVEKFNVTLFSFFVSNGWRLM